MNHVKNCESCGMPMRHPEDFGGGDTNNKYCCYCTYENGELKTYEEVFTGFTNFIIKTQGLEKKQAEKAVKESLANMSAWKNHKL